MVRSLGKVKINLNNIYFLPPDNLPRTIDVWGGGGYGISDAPGQGEGCGLKIRDYGERPL